MLVLSPHPDDSILGAGGTIARFLEDGNSVFVLTFARHAPPVVLRSEVGCDVDEAANGLKHLGNVSMKFLDYDALALPEVPKQVLCREVQEQVNDFNPAIVLVPFYDRNCDHRLIFDVAMIITRPHCLSYRSTMVLTYETLSSTYCNAPHIEPYFIPQIYFDISMTIERKLEGLSCCKSQIGNPPHPRSLEAIRSLAVLRGSQVGMKFAEAFQIVRMTFMNENEKS